MWMPTTTRLQQPPHHSSKRGKGCNRRRLRASVVLAFLSLTVQKITTTCHALSSSQSPLTLEQFTFAPNGVCLNPATFVQHLPEAESAAATSRIFTLRNVPGTGDCMFQAVILASLTSMGLGGNDVLLRAISRETRAVVAQILQSATGNLVIEGNRLVPARDLLRSAAQQEGVTPQVYLEKLQLEGRDGGLYGGGPELTVLSNVLRRPISIYEVDHRHSTSRETTNTIISNDGLKDSSTTSIGIECKGVFGGDRFADPCANIPDSAILSGLQPGAYSWHLHILVLDVASTGEKHACVLLPQDSLGVSNSVTKPQSQQQ